MAVRGLERLYDSPTWKPFCSWAASTKFYEVNAMAFLGENWGWKHTLATLLLVFVGAALVRRNFLGVPALVDNLVGSVATPLSGILPKTS